MQADVQGERAVRYAEQQFEKGYVLHIDHERRSATFRKPGQADASCSYSAALRAEALLKTSWGGQIAHRGAQREAEGTECARLLILELRDAHTRFVHAQYEGSGESERTHLKALAEKVMALGQDLTTAAETALRATL